MELNGYPPFFGYRPAFVGGNATVFLAEPEKALLDLIHLTPRGDTIAFLEELRLLVREYLQARILEGLLEQGAFPGILNAPARAGIPIRRHRSKTRQEVRG